MLAIFCHAPISASRPPSITRRQTVPLSGNRSRESPPGLGPAVGKHPLPGPAGCGIAAAPSADRAGGSWHRTGVEGLVQALDSEGAK